MWNPEYKITRFNHAFERLTGLSASEVLGKKLDILFPRESRETSLDLIRKTAGGKRWEVVEIPILRTDGTVRTVLWNSATLFATGSTTPIATIAQGQDITERKQAEDAVKETTDYLDNLFNYANAPIIVWNPEYKITRFNHAFEALTGLAAKEVLGKELDILFPQESRENSLNLIRETVTGERWEVVEIPIRHIDGSVRTVLWNSATIYSPDGITPVATIAQGQDITDLKNTQEKLLSYERLATIGKVSGSIAHEIRNPLAVIDSSIFYLDKILPNEDERVKTHLNRIMSATRRCAVVIEALLKLTHPEELRLGNVNLKKLVDTLLAEDCPPGVQTVKNYTVGDVAVRGDEAQLSIALRNIVTNAVQAMNGSGTLAVIIKPYNDSVEITFRDTGPGIAPENISKIFEPLFTTKAKGIGLGLSIAKAIIELHQGTVSVASTPGTGATFTIRLPLFQAPEP